MGITILTLFKLINLFLFNIIFLSSISEKSRYTKWVMSPLLHCFIWHLHVKQFCLKWSNRNSKIHLILSLIFLLCILNNGVYSFTEHKHLLWVLEDGFNLSMHSSLCASSVGSVDSGMCNTICSFLFAKLTLLPQVSSQISTSIRLSKQQFDVELNLLSSNG